MRLLLPLRLRACFVKADTQAVLPKDVLCRGSLSASACGAAALRPVATFQERRSRTEARLLRRLCRLVARWQRRDRQRHVREERHRAEAERTAAAAARREQQSIRIAEQERWRHITRADMTMAEIMSERRS
mmetsp:Transcript_29136/g.96763  ORF Transcript_29136/g.96763 Transcript_29136/m.96763 type:complete len:131 (+) Transcript_29136:184-576(+)